MKKTYSFGVGYLDEKTGKFLRNKVEWDDIDLDDLLDENFDFRNKKAKIYKGRLYLTGKWPSYFAAEGDEEGGICLDSDQKYPLKIGRKKYYLWTKGEPRLEKGDKSRRRSSRKSRRSSRSRSVSRRSSHSRSRSRRSSRKSSRSHSRSVSSRSHSNSVSSPNIKTYSVHVRLQPANGGAILKNITPTKQMIDIIKKEGLATLKYTWGVAHPKVDVKGSKVYFSGNFKEKMEQDYLSLDEDGNFPVSYQGKKYLIDTRGTPKLETNYR